MLRMFKCQSGMIIAFGFDMIERKENKGMISWSDTDGEQWYPKDGNLAGNVLRSEMNFAPEFVRELSDGKILAYQPGLLVEMLPMGPTFVWQFTYYTPDEEREDG